MVSNRRRSLQQGFSLIELLIVIAIIALLVALASPVYNKVRMNSLEVTASGEIRTINTEEVQYYSQFGVYATSLAQLGPAAQGAPEGPNAAGLIPPDLASGSSKGYNFTLSQTPGGYALSVVPKQFGSTGRRTFYTDQSAVVRENWGQEPATANSPVLK